MSTVAAPRKINPLLAAYLANLVAHPLRTRRSLAVSRVLQFIQEVLATHLAGVPARRVSKDAPSTRTVKAPKMTLYGMLISAPMSHALTSLAAKVGQLLVSNLVVAPIQIAVYLSCTAVINGARTVDDVRKTVKAGFMNALRVTWMTLPLTIVIAQRYLAPELWVPFMNLVQFVTGTYFNTKMKKIRMAMDAKGKKEEKRE
ncbi:uncharacterized protein B0H18DRAFT_969010 [Fomitopsis serialis]|uniref:uncharacterized protein n=1 Tax=Fomitopsis serialis TaxID=139415 RepID=UPI0020083D13|nr:uncharacterized protein B0H18DRAFT_969010 [Neoantrodia serialis]KAH9937071.1 hypothetical protein B0H18DRAFT_969010 [Neoantrodia serialis]